jgi:hypothetical protein
MTDGFEIEAGPVLIHLAAEVVAVVGKKVDDDAFAAGFQDSCSLGDGGCGMQYISQGQDDQGGIAGVVVDGNCGQFAAAEIDVGEICDSPFGSFQHGGGVVDADDALDVGGDFGGDVAGAGTEVGDDE